jgi:PKD repeat protein
MFRKLPILLVFTLMASIGHGQDSTTYTSNLFIDTSYTIQEMVDAFFTDSDVIPSNASHTGSPLSVAFFDAGDTDMDINAGIFLTSGNALDAANTAAFFASFPLGTDGDADLEAQVNDGFPSFDASILEMDITPLTSDTICFYYVFASEEYPGWVFTPFNDIFAFFISGGPEYDTMTNIAVIPQTDPPVPVSINTVNQHLFSNYYIPQYITDSSTQAIQYLDSTDLAYNGMTYLLPAKAYVTPGETYHIKIGITDVSDAVFDSGVFIGIQSLGGDSLLTPVANASLSISGDSLQIENESMFAKAFSWDFGDGTYSTERHPGLHVYEEAGAYEVSLTVSSWCCSATFTETVEISPLEISANFEANTSNCEASNVQFHDTSVGDITSWAWSFPGGTPSSSTDQSPVVTYPEAGLYNVSLTVTTADGQTATTEQPDYMEILPLPVSAFDVETDNGLTVAFANTAENAEAYLWNFGDGNMSNDFEPVHTYAQDGTYTVSLLVINECGEAISTQDIQLVISSTSLLQETAFAVYPNPIGEHLYIQAREEGNYQLAIFNLEGKNMLQRSQLSGSGSIPAGSLETGTYILQITNDEGVYNQLINKE